MKNEIVAKKSAGFSKTTIKFKSKHIFSGVFVELKQVIVIRSDLGMGKGKLASQTAHASIEAMDKTLKKEPEWVGEWKESGMAKVVLKIGSEKELLELFEKVKKLIPTALIHDAGRTQIESGTPTCIGIGPAPESEIDRFTKHLKLL